ncbi:MAG: PhnD/SsuA/transferrin family substrate-binding protein [Bdellovibrionales bacterium]|nr:PhnD/SsuA/transferrin family substrate-binding protein [Bdellovibrionales bacterium]
MLFYTAERSSRSLLRPHSLFLVLLAALHFSILGTSLGYAEENGKPTYKLAVTDITGLEELQREFKAFQNLLTQFTGSNFELTPVTGRTVVIEALRRKRLDFALTGPAEYVATNSRTQVVPVVALARKHYRASIITTVKSGITSLDQLKGEKIGFGDFGSTSYHLAPLQLLSDAGISIQRDIQPVNLDKHIVWQSLLKGQLKAIGFNEERFEQFLSEDNSLSRENFRILAVGPELPGDLFIAGSHVPSEVIDAVRNAFQNHGEDLLKAMLIGKRNAKYGDVHFETRIADSDYDYIRQMYRTAGLEQFSSAS